MAADFSWTPPLVVLTLGAVAGALVVAVRSRFKTQGVSPAAVTSEASDLKQRYDALIRRLAEGASLEDRAAIELEAAQVLMEMESKASVPQASTRKAGTASTPAADLTPAPMRRTPAWLGFLYGILTMATLVSLFYFASRGSTERAPGGSPTGGGGMGASAAADQPQTTAEDDAALAVLEASILKTPKDIPRRIELTRAYLQRRDLMRVFDQTKAILEIEPGNPHGLTYQALVRVAMGQAGQAETMLVEAIRKNPRIEDAYIHLAIARIQLGNREAAEEAIQEGQKQFPEDKARLAEVFSQIASAAESSGEPATAEHPEAAPAAAASAVSRTSASLVVVVELAQGIAVPPDAILFVIAREAGFETGPPVAVRRVPALRFPITLTLSDQDSMSGESLPGLIRIDARIDRDGDPLTKDPRDPIASEDNVRPGSGQILLVLSPGKL